MFSWLNPFKRPQKPALTPAELARAIRPPQPPTPEPELEPSDGFAYSETAVLERAPEPDLPQHPRRALEALLQEGRLAEAEAMFDALPPGTEDAEWFALSGLRAAQRAHDDARILDFAARLRAAAPTSPKGYGAACFQLRQLGRLADAEAMAQAGLDLFPKAAGLLREAAEIAAANGDAELAYDRCARLRATAPKLPAGFVTAIRLGTKLQQPERTKPLLAEALAVFPEDREILLLAARQAAYGLLWTDAAAHWQKLMALHPVDPAIALEAATSFIGPRRGRNKRLPAVLDQLSALHVRFPDYIPAYVEHVRALREAERLEEAEAMGREWLARFPDSQPLAMALARLAEDRGRPEQSVALLAGVREAGGGSAKFEAAWIRALGLAGRDSEAEAACRAALARFPRDYMLIERFIALATRRGDFADAAARADEVLCQYPHNESLRRLAERLRALSGEGHPEAPPAPGEEADGLASFFTQFESLGATSGGCEFGLVQRQFGAEPLGLLRWGNMPIEGLTKGLQSRFEGLGDPETTRIVVQRGSADHQEYFIYDDRYGYWAHTFIKKDDAPQDRVLKQSLRRLAFLRDKLLEDLDQASKILVFKMTVDVGRPALEALFEALQAYGDNVLLAVGLADAAHPRGSLEMLRPGLFLGHAGMFMGVGSVSGAGIDASLWRHFCEQVAGWKSKEGLVF